MGALIGSLGEPAHIAVLAGREEVMEPGAGVGAKFSPSEADRIEAEGQGAVANGVLQRMGHGSGTKGAGPAGTGGENRMGHSAQTCWFG